MAIEAVKIPQNVYVEERIVGPVTLRQIIITMIGAGFSYALWGSMKAAGPVSLIGTILAWTPCAIAAAFAFIKVQGISLLRLCLLLLERLEKPSVRVWHPRQGIAINIKISAPKKMRPTEVASKDRAEARIKELSALLDTEIETEASPPIPVKTVEKQEESMLPATESSDVLTTEEPIETKPVNPNRISVDSIEGSIEGLRDLSPPA